MSSFKFLTSNPYKDRCNLQVSSTFLFEGNFCTVTNMLNDGFGYINHSKPSVDCYMTYRFYLSLPSVSEIILRSE